MTDALIFPFLSARHLVSLSRQAYDAPHDAVRCASKTVKLEKQPKLEPISMEKDFLVGEIWLSARGSGFQLIDRRLAPLAL